MIERSHKPLAMHKAPKALGYQQPCTFTYVAVNSPAISVMTDLRNISAATIGPEATLAQATSTMMGRNVRLLLVVGADQAVLGLITARDTQGQRPIQWLHERGGKYADLLVSDLMTAAGDIDIIDIRDVLHAEVGHVVATLKASGRQHALVAEQDPVTGSTHVRGIFSATQIGRQLGVAVQAFDVANTFAEIERTLVR
jgi:CBS domain-containing protein